MKHVSFDIAVWAKEHGYTGNGSDDYYSISEGYIDTYSLCGFEVHPGDLIVKEQAYNSSFDVTKDLIPAPTVLELWNWLPCSIDVVSETRDSFKAITDKYVGEGNTRESAIEDAIRFIKINNLL